MKVKNLELKQPKNYNDINEIKKIKNTKIIYII